MPLDSYSQLFCLVTNDWRHIMDSVGCETDEAVYQTLLAIALYCSEVASDQPWETGTEVTERDVIVGAVIRIAQRVRNHAIQRTEEISNG